MYLNSRSPANQNKGGTMAKKKYYISYETNYGSGDYFIEAYNQTEAEEWFVNCMGRAQIIEIKQIKD